MCQVNDLVKCVFGPLTIEVRVLKREDEWRKRYECRIYLGDEEPFVSQISVYSRESLDIAALNILCDLKDVSGRSDEMQRSIEGWIVGRAEEDVLKQMHAFWSWASQRQEAIQRAAEAAGIASVQKG